MTGTRAETGSGAGSGAGTRAGSGAGSLHHVELWVPDLGGAVGSWGWLLTELGWHPYQRWDAGRSWRLGGTYLVLEQSPARSGDRHDRLAPGLNHLAFHAGPPAEVDRLAAAAPGYGWRLLFPDRHPYAGGAGTYAAYLEDGHGYEVELVAREGAVPGSAPADEGS